MEIKKVIESIVRKIIASGVMVFCACVIFLAGVVIIIAGTALVNHALCAYTGYIFWTLVICVANILICMMLIAAFAIIIFFAAGGIYLSYLFAMGK